MPLMVPRAVAGGYVAGQVMDREGVEDPWAMAMGAAVAAGTAALAPRIRGLLSTVLGIPGPVLGLALPVMWTALDQRGFQKRSSGNTPRSR